MDENLIIEPITKSFEPQTVDFINSILKSEFPDSLHHLAADDLENLCDNYKGKRDLFLVLKTETDIIGTVAIKEDSRQVALLRRLFVSPQYRNKGYGKLLIQKAIDFCIDKKYEMICFRGNNQMDGAIKIIEKFGFIKKDLIDFGSFHIYIYVKLL